MIKKIIFIGVLMSVFVACKEAATNVSTTEETEEVPVIENGNSTSTEAQELSNRSSSGKKNKALDLERTVTDFITCKKASEHRSDCRNSITKVISEMYDVPEFIDSKTGYVVYDSIRSIIAETNRWEDLGVVSTDVIDRAVAHTNNGGLSLVIDTAETYGHVVLLLSGETKKSNSWGMHLPYVLSLTNYKPEKSFSNKTLAYAMKKSDALRVYIRK